MTDQKDISAPGPLHHKLFRFLWIAAVASNIGTSLHNVGAAWLMTSLAPSPIMVALLSTATSLSIFLLALPAGAFAEIFDRRKLLLVTQYFMLVVAAILAGLTITGITTPSILLIFTFLLGMGAATSMPSTLGVFLGLVQKSEARHTITLSGVAINIGLAVGPTLGGFVVASSGSWAAFGINAASFVGMIIFLHTWKRNQQHGVLPPEHVIAAIRTGLRYIRHSPLVHALFVRDIAFAIPSSALMALLPLLSRQTLGLDSTGFGFLVGSVGLGAIIGGFLILPKLPKSWSIERRFACAIFLFAFTMIVLSYQRDFVLLCLAMVGSGIAQITIMSSLNFSSYKSSPKWVGTRVLSVHVLTLQGSMAVGSVLWGSVGEIVGIPTTFLFAAIGLIVGLVTMIRFPLPASKEIDMTPSMHWPVPQIVIEPAPDDGPVLITVDYKIDPNKANEFVAAMKELQNIRLRDGAISWDLYHDPADASHYIEIGISESWVEHMRQHERVTVPDKDIEERVRAFHIGDKPQVISHFIAKNLNQENGMKKVD
ncbi:MAG: MFS transporter [Nitrosopumilaceae archaeon]